MEKICSLCKESKPLTTDFFATRKDRDGWQSLCRDCQKIYRKEHYLKNKQKYIDKASAYRIEFKRRFFTWLSTQQCADCENNDFRVLEFDHRYDKLFNVSEILNSCSAKLLWEEVAKCDIVCANCHRIRTAVSFNYYNYM